MIASVIGAKLDLLVRLVDTTTGADVKESNVLFLKDDKPIRPERRGTGTYVFINTGREDFLMRIRVTGYEEYKVFVDYSSLDQHLPICDAFLIPSENLPGGLSHATLKGNLPFLKSIEAINLQNPLCSFQAYDVKKNLMSVYNATGGVVHLISGCYGLFDREKKKYEKIEVTGTVTSQSFRLKDPVSAEVVQGSPVCRIVYGSVSEDGDYLLRVSDDATELMYLVRFASDEEEYFQMADMHKPDAFEIDPDVFKPKEDSTDDDMSEEEEVNEYADSDGSKSDVLLRNGAGTAQGNTERGGAGGGKARGNDI